MNHYFHPFFSFIFYIQFYLFILLGFSYVSRAKPNRTRRIPTVPSDRIRPEPKIRPDSKSVRNPKSELFQKKLFRVVHPRTASNHFSLEHPREQFKLDHLVLHILKYEVIGSGSAILQDPDLSYLCGISHSFIFFSSSQTLYSHNFIFSCHFYVIFTSLPKIFTTQSRRMKWCKSTLGA